MQSVSKHRHYAYRSSWARSRLRLCRAAHCTELHRRMRARTWRLCRAPPRARSWRDDPCSSSTVLHAAASWYTSIMHAKLLCRAKFVWSSCTSLARNPRAPEPQLPRTAAPANISPATQGIISLAYSCTRVLGHVACIVVSMVWHVPVDAFSRRQPRRSTTSQEPPRLRTDPASWARSLIACVARASPRRVCDAACDDM